MTAKTLVAFLAVAILAGGAAGAGTAWLLRQDDQTRDPGRIVTVAPMATVDKASVLEQIEREPRCNSFHRFCITRNEEGEYVALYTADTYQGTRELGCSVYWDPDATFEAEGGRPITGLFLTPCIGDRFDRTGKRIFGPAPRDLDQFRLIIGDDSMKVDTRSLICGTGATGEVVDECLWAPVLD